MHPNSIPTKLWRPLSALALMCGSLLFGAESPSFYSPQATWQETMLASLTALADVELEDNLAGYESETIRLGEPPRRISIDVSGAREMYLFVAGYPDVKRAVADWAEPVLTRVEGTREPLTKAKNFRVLKGRHELDMTLRSGLYDKIRIAGRRFERGVNVQADSVILVPLDGQYTRFEAWIGVDDYGEETASGLGTGELSSGGSVRFSILGSKAAARRRLFDVLARNFTDGTSRRQMAWAREDRIFDFNWKPGDWGALIDRYSEACHRVPPIQTRVETLAAVAKTKANLARVRDMYYASREIADAVSRAREFDFEGLRAALADLGKDFPDKFSPRHLRELDRLQAALTHALGNIGPDSLDGYQRVADLQASLEHLKQTALLSNPLLDFDRLLVIKRVPRGDARRNDWEGYGFGEYIGMPRQSSWNYGTMPNVDKWSNEIATLSPIRPEGTLATLFRPQATPLVADVDLHWDGDRMLFSMPDKNANWQVCEVRTDGSGFRQLTPSAHLDVHNYDPTYLPDDDIIFLSTAPLQGVPCNASVIVGMMYKMGPNGENIHQLTFEQDHDYTPSVLNNGRVLYLRWDYTDTPHVWNRLLMSMNPDGTGQMEYYGANSYWPNAIFYARPIPNHPTKIVGIVTGHHEGRVGELFLFDPAKGRHELSGVVQRIPRRGKPVQARIEDKLTEHSWPKFLHPWPLSDKYFLVACKPEPDSLWGIYLVDAFDNRVLIKEEEGFALLEPVPLKPRPKPPVIQDRTLPASEDALVYMEDICSGPGLKGVPPGTVKSLRIFTYHFGYQRLAGIDHRVGADGPWEAKRVLGTVPVEEDGSALFTVPAKLPLSFQPLDAEGKAIALMRSWMTPMPGESVSCVGCHDRQSSAPPAANRRLALLRPPSRITPTPGPPRGFSFVHDVQPVLDKYCVGCHNSSKVAEASTAKLGGGSDSSPAAPLPDLRRDQGGFVVYRNGELDSQFIRGVPKVELLGKYGAVFEPSYAALRPYVRVGGLESDLHLLPAMEFHADTSELIRLLRKGHHNVQLDPDAWNQLITWIDLNAPCHGRWGDITKIPGNQCARRLELRKLYGGPVENWETMPELDTDYDFPIPVIPPTEARPNQRPKPSGWPLSVETARQQQASCDSVTRTLDLGNGISMEFCRIPAGQFVMGQADGTPDECPPTLVKIEKAFWMARCEVSNEQFARFDPCHDSRFEHRSSWIFSEAYLGWPLNRPRQPVVRVSWLEATAFCRWLSQKAGASVTLPSEAQWEYACRAGTATPLSYGDLDTDFSRFGNMGDSSLRQLAAEGWRPKAPDLVSRDERFDDGALVTVEVGGYEANRWGLFDMHGNAAEWTRSSYLPYPYAEKPAVDSQGKKVVRGGSWRDRPKDCRSAFRYAYQPWQKVYNVGFRVIIEEP